MALTSRITLTGAPEEEPEDFFGSSLGVIFPDDVMNQHGDADHGVLYESPFLPKPLHISLATPDGDEDRRLFSHYLWNSSLLLAEFIEADTLGLGLEPGGGEGPEEKRSLGPAPGHFDVTGLATLELGAGTALPSLLSALLGARRTVVTDYPAPAVISNLRANVARNVRPEMSPLGPGKMVAAVEAEGHSWGEFPPLSSLSSSSTSSSSASSSSNPGGLEVLGRHAFDRMFVCDCLWMPWQHGNLHRSVEWFLRDSDDARCWVVAGFHTGREKMRGFFEAERLAELGLEVETIWERDCDGIEREWSWDRGFEDPVGRKRWLTCAILKRKAGGTNGMNGAGNVETQ